MAQEIENKVLCGANSYVEKYYFNEEFAGLPEHIKEELKILCVLYTEEIGGSLILEFTPEGELQFRVAAEDSDYLFDEIGSALKIKQYQNEKKELLESLELYYKVFVMGLSAESVLDEERLKRYQNEEAEQLIPPTESDDAEK